MTIVESIEEDFVQWAKEVFDSSKVQSFVYKCRELTSNSILSLDQRNECLNRIKNRGYTIKFQLNQNGCSYIVITNETQQESNPLDKGAYNTYYCSNCIFHPIQDKRKDIPMSQRMKIVKPIIELTSFHKCHHNNKTCFGSIGVFAFTMYQDGLLETDSPNDLLNLI